ncbi:hypothetical protein P1J78_23615 [Psychromarinibacter sp. C21-152]|uniref:Uncharacterized protein n=1 Tax=Psychromarinibacter sediminicola TaxID=3033385 RepID=A0AAE3TCJ4_9RHOB|nr:hypothetical protein [Psychromarinibacter sediminicola]MDF0603715.1 hypothetical protein [Psychromarinibacter sediminicola]
MSLADLVGSWTGNGIYYEALSKAKMKCRLAATGDAARVKLTGRCGSSLGARDLSLEFVRQDDGSILLLSADTLPSVETGIERVDGEISNNQLNLSGTSPGEYLKLQFALNADGSLHFATERKWRTGKSRSVVTLRPR